MPNRVTYTREELLALRQKECGHIQRRTRRFLFYLGILNRKVCHTRQFSIPVRITERKWRGGNSGASNDVDVVDPRSMKRCLQRVKRVGCRLTSPGTSFPPLLFSNVRCLRNKMDETSLRLKQLSPGIAIFCETWLSEDIPDCAVSIPCYNIIRQDRDCKGGGIIAYVSENLKTILIDEHSVTCLKECPTEFLSFVIPERSLLVIALYHPFWNDNPKHEEAVACLTSIIDFCLFKVHRPS